VSIGNASTLDHTVAPWCSDAAHHVVTRSTRTSLVLARDLPIEAWCDIGRQIFMVSESSVWWLGDWLVFGERAYPGRYKRAMQATKLNYQTLRNYAWAARRFPPARRRAGLSLQHHVEVAGLPPDEQDHWLELAERFRWSRDELRRQLRASVSEDRQRLESADYLKLAFPRERVELWTNAARNAGADLNEWIEHVLDSAVRTRPAGVSRD
jgi:predicted HicB family RNase H-like nuclease